MSVTIAILLTEPAASDEERLLQETLNCPVLTPAQFSNSAQSVDFILRLRDGVLSLQSTAAGAPGALSIDFADQMLHKRALDGLARQGLGKAVGLKKQPLPEVLDATAGLGSDAFLLASAGCEVRMLERSPVVHALLANALHRACSHAESESGAITRMQLQCSDFLQTPLSPSSVDVVYLDPMFPADRKSAKSGKGMFLLQELLGYECDELAMLEKARDVARQRVVVKRGKRSPQFAGREPDICFRGSSSRFDVYLNL